MSQPLKYKQVLVEDSGLPWDVGSVHTGKCHSCGDFPREGVYRRCRDCSTSICSAPGCFDVKGLKHDCLSGNNGPFPTLAEEQRILALHGAKVPNRAAGIPEPAEHSVDNWPRYVAAQAAQPIVVSSAPAFNIASMNPPRVYVPRVSRKTATPKTAAKDTPKTPTKGKKRAVPPTVDAEEAPRKVRRIVKAPVPENPAPPTAVSTPSGVPLAVEKNGCRELNIDVSKMNNLRIVLAEGYQVFKTNDGLSYDICMQIKTKDANGGVHAFAEHIARVVDPKTTNLRNPGTHVSLPLDNMEGPAIGEEDAAKFMNAIMSTRVVTAPKQNTKASSAPPATTSTAATSPTVPIAIIADSTRGYTPSKTHNRTMSGWKNSTQEDVRAAIEAKAARLPESPSNEPANTTSQTTVYVQATLRDKSPDYNRSKSSTSSEGAPRAAGLTGSVSPTLAAAEATAEDARAARALATLRKNISELTGDEEGI
ncbi:hypothetical protein EJ08DRAFT_693751 [Tothia fuscella]|uniref:Uncharacterized protein n=1 Tax=Tothia fuscella TaxID=1048955 RepID=A0A9P4NYQ6_9PEZI|nr:hypothetical protein EJ08DRAFT_693751 [Tothia fuscella]